MNRQIARKKRSRTKSIKKTGRRHSKVSKKGSKCNRRSNRKSCKRKSKGKKTCSWVKRKSSGKRKHKGYCKRGGSKATIKTLTPQELEKNFKDEIDIKKSIDSVVNKSIKREDLADTLEKIIDKIDNESDIIKRLGLWYYWYTMTPQKIFLKKNFNNVYNSINTLTLTLDEPIEVEMKYIGNSFFSKKKKIKIETMKFTKETTKSGLKNNIDMKHKWKGKIPGGNDTEFKNEHNWTSPIPPLGKQLLFISDKYYLIINFNKEDYPPGTWVGKLFYKNYEGYLGYIISGSEHHLYYLKNNTKSHDILGKANYYDNTETVKVTFT